MLSGVKTSDLYIQTKDKGPERREVIGIQAHMPPWIWQNPMCVPTVVGPSWGHVCCSPSQTSLGWPMPYVNETDRYGSMAQGHG